MVKPTLVLDANAFSTPGLFHWLAGYDGRKVLPIVAYVEVGVHQASRGKLERFRAALAESEVEIEWTRNREADQTIALATDPEAFAENARDLLIAGHVHGDRVLVTSNVKDFAFLAHVLDPKAAMAKYA